MNLFKLWKIYRKVKPDIDKLEKEIKMGTKPWWKSETIWAGIVSVIGGLIPMIDQNFGTHVASSPFFGLFMSIVGGLVIHGRATTTSTVTMGGPTIPPTSGG